MIQISSPIQEQSPALESNYRQELVENKDSPAFDGSQKKNKLGVFARLLEGLQSKITKNSAVVDSGKISGFPVEAENETLEVVSNSKITRIFPVKAVVSQENSEAEGIEGRFSDNLRLDSEEEALAAIKKEEFSFIGVFSGDNPPKTVPREAHLQETNPKEGFSKSANTELETQLSMELPAEGEAKALLQKGKAENTKTSNFLSVSFREMEEEFQANRSLKLNAETNPVFQAQGAERENPKLSDSRFKKGKEKLNIDVYDLRTAEMREAGSIDVSKGLGVSGQKVLSSEIEIPIDLKLSSGKGEALKNSDNFSRAWTFEDALAKELRGNLSTDIVRNAAVIVRNGGEGTIRLSLHPASLGDVKIRLELTENKITGHIIVESNDALRAFERELPVLEKAFRDSGFSETNLEMSLYQDGGDFGSHEQRQEGNFLAQVLAASRYDESDLSAMSLMEELSDPVHAGMVFTPGRKPVNLLV